jgi:DNA-binding LacI/PurR family transcriptional regulator
MAVRSSRYADADAILRWLIAQRLAIGARSPTVRDLVRRMGITHHAAQTGVEQLLQRGVLRRQGPRILVIDRLPCADATAQAPSCILCVSLSSVADDGQHPDAYGIGTGILHGVIERIDPRQHQVVVIRPHLDQLGRLAPELRQRLSGLIIIPDAFTSFLKLPLYQRLRRSGMPLACSCDNLSPAAAEAALRSDLDLVACDQRQGMLRLCEALAQRGVRRPVRLGPMVGPPIAHPKYQHWCLEQEHAFVAACQRTGLHPLPSIPLAEIDPQVVERWGDGWTRQLAGYVVELLRAGRSDAPDALLLQSDSLIPAAAEALRLVGIPRQRRPVLVGYDGNFWTTPWLRAWGERVGAEPDLTVRNPLRQIGHALADTLLHRIAHPTAPPQRRSVAMTVLTAHAGRKFADT